MKIFLPSTIGFCFGVTNALRLAKLELEKKGNPVYSLGELIHNPLVIEGLTKKGMKVISNFSLVNKGTVITRAHGIDPSLIKEGEKRGLRVIDATCPYVAKVQKIAKFLSQQSYQIIMIGSESHPEVRAVKSNIPDQRMYILSDPAQVEDLPQSKKIGVIAQTTELLDNFQNIVKNLIKRKGEIRVFNTICEVIRQRQVEVKRLAKKVQAMIIVGGHNSSNTYQLVKLCQSLKRKTYFVEREKDLNFDELKGFETIGIAGGTSTPQEIIQNIKKILITREGEKSSG